MTDLRSRRHSTTTMARAIELRSAGWPPGRITELLERETGMTIGRNTILRWTDPRHAERERQRSARRHRKQYIEQEIRQVPLPKTTPEYRLAFMRRLEDERLSCRAIGIVHGVVFGEPLTHHQVRYALKGES